MHRILKIALAWAAMAAGKRGAKVMGLAEWQGKVSMHLQCTHTIECFRMLAGHSWHTWISVHKNKDSYRMKAILIIIDGEE